MSRETVKVCAILLAVTTGKPSIPTPFLYVKFGGIGRRFSLPVADGDILFDEYFPPAL